MAAKTPSISIYRQLVRITDVYLGPAAERFIARQIDNHLHKPPAEITCEDLASLVDWIQMTVSLLTDDQEVVDEYIGQIRALAQPAKPVPRKISSSKK